MVVDITARQAAFPGTTLALTVTQSSLKHFYVRLKALNIPQVILISKSHGNSEIKCQNPVEVLICVPIKFSAAKPKSTAQN